MFKIEHTTDTIESIAGLALAGKLIDKMGIKNIKSAVKKYAGEILAHFIGMLTLGEISYESINAFRKNEFFREALGLEKVLSADTLRLYLEDLCSGDNENLLNQLRESNKRLLNISDLGMTRIEGKKYLFVDIDTSPMDNSGTKKEGIGYTYKGFVGYHPIFAYIGRAGFMADCEMRPGSQHCQKGTPEFLRRLKDSLKETAKGKRLLFRLDSGNDAVETIRAILEGGKNNHLIIKRNLRREDPQWWLKTAKKHGVRTRVRKGKFRYCGIISGRLLPGCLEPGLDIAFEVIERKIDREGNKLLIPEIEVNSWWTNLAAEAETIIAVYHDHGTMEQYHSEFKNDIGLERFPSGKYEVNKTILTLGMCAFNILRYMGQEVIAQKEILPVNIRSFRRRIGKVIKEIIRMACKVVHHGGSLIIKIWEEDPWTPVFDRLYENFCNL